MQRARVLRYVCSGLVWAAAAGMGGGIAHGEDKLRLPGGGNFHEADDWSPAGVPTLGDTAIFNTASGYQGIFFDPYLTYQSDALRVLNEDNLSFYGYNADGLLPTYTLTQTGSATPSLAIAPDAGNLGRLYLSQLRLLGQHATLAAGAGSQAQWSISDGGEAVFTGSVFVGGSDSAPGGTADVYVSRGALRLTGPASTLKIYNGTVQLYDGLLETPDIDVDPGATFGFYGGLLKLTGAAGLTVGDGQLLGQWVSLGDNRQLTVASTLTIETDSYIWLDGGTLTIGDLQRDGVLYFNQGALRVTAADVHIGSTSSFTDFAYLRQNMSVIADLDLHIDADGGMYIDGGSVSARNVYNNGYFDFRSGHLNLGQNLTIGSGELLSDYVILDNNRHLSVAGHTSVADDSYLEVGPGGSFTTATLSVGINAQFAFNGGAFTLTGQDLALGLATPPGAFLLGQNAILHAGDSITVGPTHTLHLDSNAGLQLRGGTVSAGDLDIDPFAVFNWVAGTLEVTGVDGLTLGEYNGAPADLWIGQGQHLRVTHDLILDYDTILTIEDQASVRAAHIQNYGGTLNWLGGTLELTDEGAYLAPGTLLGDHLTLGAGKALILPRHESLGIANDASLTIDGGALTTGYIWLNESSTFNFHSGSIHLTNDGLYLHPGSLFGDHLTLDPEDALAVTYNTQVPNGSSLVIDGGSLTTQSLYVDFGGTFAYLRGVLHLTEQDVALGSSGPSWAFLLADSLTLNPGDALILHPDRTAYLDAAAVFNLHGGTFSAGRIEVDPNASVDWTTGTLEITGPGGVTLGEYLGLPADMWVENGQNLFITHTLALDPGTSLTVETGAALRAAHLYANGGTLNWLGGSIELTGDSVYINPASLFGDHLVLGPGKSLTLAPDAEFVLDNLTSLTLSGGSLTTGYLRRWGAAAITFTSGHLTLANQHLALGLYEPYEAVLLGPSLTLNAGDSVQLAPDHTLYLDSAASLTLNGGTLSVGNFDIDPDASFDWMSGIFEITGTDGVTLGAYHGAPADLWIGDGQDFRVTHSFILPTDTSLTIETGAALLAGRLENYGGTLNWLGGAIELTDADVILDEYSLFGDNLDLGPGKSLTLAPEHVLNVADFASLTLSGGSLTTGQLWVASAGSFSFNLGDINLTDQGIVLGNIFSPYLDLISGRNLRVRHEVWVPDGTSLLITGGTFIAGSLRVDPTGSFSYLHGVLGLNNQDLHVQPGGLLGNAVNLIAGDALLFPNNNIIVGSDADGALDAANATVEARNLILGRAPDTFGEVSFTGADAHLLIHRDMVIGEQGEGDFTLLAGAHADVAQWVYLGSSDASPGGYALVDGPGTVWNIGGDLRVGHRTNGQINLGNAAVINVGQWVVLGADLPTIRGDLDIQNLGTQLNIDGDLRVGNAGDGQVLLSDQAHLTVGLAMILGADATGSGLVAVTGLNTSLTVGTDLIVGDNGIGEFSIDAAANADIAGNLAVGLRPGSDGNVQITGPDTLLHVDHQVVIGGNWWDYAPGGAAIVTISPQATLAADADIHVIAAGVLELDHGNLIAPSLILRDNGLLIGQGVIDIPINAIGIGRIASSSTEDPLHLQNRVTITNGTSLVHSGPGDTQFHGTFHWGANATFHVLQGNVLFDATAGAPTEIDGPALLRIESGSVTLSASIDPLTDTNGTEDIDDDLHVDILNNAVNGLLVADGSTHAGTLDGSGDTTVAPTASLTVKRLRQRSLTIDGGPIVAMSISPPATPLTTLLPGPTAGAAPTPIPEPSSLALLAPSLTLLLRRRRR